MPKRKKVISRPKRTKVKHITAPTSTKRIPPAQLAKLYEQYMMAGGSQTGMGFLDWVKGADNTVWNGAKKVHKFVKDYGLASKALTAIGTVTAQPELIAAGTAAGAIGYGKRRPRKQIGGGVISIVQNPHKPMLSRY